MTSFNQKITKASGSVLGNATLTALTINVPVDNFFIYNTHSTSCLGIEINSGSSVLEAKIPPQTGRDFTLQTPITSVLIKDASGKISVWDSRL